MVAERMQSNSFQLKGWRFESESGPILDTKGRDALTERLKEVCEDFAPHAVPLALPEAIFRNRLTLTHEATGHSVHFDAEGAITCWLRESAHKGSRGLRVKSASLPSWKQIANDWAKDGVTDYDWTFSTDYCGRTTSSSNPGAAGPLKPATLRVWLA